MASRLSSTIACAVLLLSTAPVWALQTITLPQPNDSSTPYQSSDNAGQNTFSNDQGSTTDNSLGRFHFSMSSNPGFANDPGYYYRPGGSSPAGYGTSNVPGSEFYNSGSPFPH